MQTIDQLAAQWQATCTAAVRSAVVILRLSGGIPTGREILDIIRSAPRTPGDVNDPGHKKNSYCQQEMAKVENALPQDNPRTEDWAVFNEAHAFFTQVMPSLGSAACALLVQSVAGILFGLRSQEFVVAPPEVWTSPLDIVTRGKSHDT